MVTSASLSGYAFAQSVTQTLSLTATDSIGDDGTLLLQQTRGIAIFESGGSTYAAVSSWVDNGVQILDVTDPSAVTAAGSIADTPALLLGSTRGIAIFESGGSTYAAVAALSPDGVQILDVTDPHAVTAAGNITDDTTSLKLDGAYGIAIFESGGSTYAAVTAFTDDGVQILDVTDPHAVTAAGSINGTDTPKLDGAAGIAIFESGSRTYAAVASSVGNGGVQILDVTDPSAVTAAGNITDTTALELEGAEAITIFESGSRTYAAVASLIDGGVQILDVTDPHAVTAAGSIVDTDATSLELSGARGIATFTSGSRTYAAVAAFDPGGVQILDVTDPSAITAAGSIADTPALLLGGARGIATFESGGSTYAAVAAESDDGVQILNITNHIPTVDAGPDRTVNERSSVTLSGSAHDPDAGDALTYSWSQDSGTPVTLADNDTLRPQFTAPGVTSDEEIAFTFTATDTAGASAGDTVTITVRDVPMSVSSVRYDSGSGTMTITFNQGIDGTPDYSLLHVRGAGSDSGGIALSDTSGTSSSGRTITATLSEEQQDLYDALQRPQLDVDRGAVADLDGVQIQDMQDITIRGAGSGKKSSTPPPAVGLGALASLGVDVPPHITAMAAGRGSDPVPPVTPDGTFDFPLVMDGNGYLLDGLLSTLVPHAAAAGQAVEIAFTVYSQNDLAHFALYLNLQGNDADYSNSDTHVTYRNDGTVRVVDPHGYVSNATVTVTQQDDKIPEKKTVTVRIEFVDATGPTNMVAYLWDTDGKATRIKMIDALDVMPAPVVLQAADPETTPPDPELQADPETTPPDPELQADPETTPPDPELQADPETTPPEPDPASAPDDEQVLLSIRMWSGFEPESITDAQLLVVLGLDYPGADIPSWVMTELGPLVVGGGVTVGEFKAALEYVLGNA